MPEAREWDVTTAVGKGGDGGGIKQRAKGKWRRHKRIARLPPQVDVQCKCSKKRLWTWDRRCVGKVGRYLIEFAS